MKQICFLILFLTVNVLAFAQRNTILIIADDLGTDYFGFYEDHIDTVDLPNIRKMVANGVRFKNLMSNPVCSSTRATLLTGRYSFRTGVGGIVGGAGGSNQIDTAEISIPKLLKKYNPSIAKANIGKWHLKQAMPAINLKSPLALGFDWAEGPFIGQLPSFTNWTKYTNGVASTVTTYATTENVNNAISWLKSQNQDKPFFLWLAFNAPHEPLHLPPAGLHTFTNLTGTMGDINSKPKQYFKAMIQAMDTEIGRLFESLRMMNKLDSTDILFIGDNGNTQRTAQIADLNKAKGTVYQYGVHVPMIFSGPSVVNKGRASDALVNTADIFATIVENFGYTNWATAIPANKPVDSKSLLPIIKNSGESIRPWSFTEIFKLTTDDADGKAIRNTEYKFIKFDNGTEEFYNLSTDPTESKNLLGANLSLTDILNYNYLCNELATLLNNATICKIKVDVEEEITHEDITIFPNPADQSMTISLGGNIRNEGQLTIIDQLGKMVYHQKKMLPNIDYTIDISALPEGTFIGIVKTGNRTFTKKIIKQ